MDEHSSSATRAVERVCAILDQLSSGGEVSLTEISRGAGLSKATALRYLGTLIACGFIERNAQSGQYRLTWRPGALSGRMLAFARTVQPLLNEARTRFGETINIGVLIDGRVIYAATAPSLASARIVVEQGDDDAFHSTAIGKILAAQLSEEALDALIARYGLAPLTDNSVTEPTRFRELVRTAARQGYALDDCENDADGRCVAVLLNLPGYQAALSLSALVSRLPLKRVPGLASDLESVAREIEAKWYE
jgi:IclR family transcriptional regulator, acetate operon repressor